MARLRRAFAASAALAAGLFGCELIVSSTVPDFRCTPGDPTGCPGGMSCDPSARVCVAGIFEGGPIDTGSPIGDDDDGGRDDGPAGGAQLGEHCGTQVTCADGLLCGTPNILTTAIVADATSSICTKPCCTSADCGEGFVCFGAGTGGNYCVSAAKAKRGDLGTKGPGASCSDNGQCRSGVCADDHCLDLCCRESDCSDGTTCRVKSIAAPPPARENWVCALAEPGASVVAASGCPGTAADKCANDNCQGIPPVCRPTCCSNADCEYPGKNLAFCAYGLFTTTQSTTKWCFTDAGGVGAPIGAACNGNTDCAGRFCDPDFKVCGTVCCRDSDCAADESCLPTATGQPYLRCVKSK